MRIFIFTIISLVLSASVDAALVERLGGLAYYDNEADLTWLADANYAQSSGYTSNRYMSLNDANIWANQLIVDGVGGWRLPNTLTLDPSCEGYDPAAAYMNCTGSEMGNLFYNVLGGTALSSIDASRNSNYDLFTNIETKLGWYWSATETNFSSAWQFGFMNGLQAELGTNSTGKSWAVHSGDIAAIPIPSAAWLFGSGLISLFLTTKRKKCT